MTLLGISGVLPVPFTLQLATIGSISKLLKLNLASTPSNLVSPNTILPLDTVTFTVSQIGNLAPVPGNPISNMDPLSLNPLPNILKFRWDLGYDDSKVATSNLTDMTSANPSFVFYPAASNGGLQQLTVTLYTHLEAMEYSSPEFPIPFPRALYLQSNIQTVHHRQHHHHQHQRKQQGYQTFRLITFLFSLMMMMNIFFLTFLHIGSLISTFVPFSTGDVIVPGQFIPISVVPAQLPIPDNLLNNLQIASIEVSPLFSSMRYGQGDSALQTVLSFPPVSNSGAKTITVSINITISLPLLPNHIQYSIPVTTLLLATTDAFHFPANIYGISNGPVAGGSILQLEVLSPVFSLVGDSNTLLPRDFPSIPDQNLLGQFPTNVPFNVLNVDVQVNGRTVTVGQVGSLTSFLVVPPIKEMTDCTQHTDPFICTTFVSPRAKQK